jgi:hypothetical protein
VDDHGGENRPNIAKPAKGAANPLHAGWFECGCAAAKALHAGWFECGCAAAKALHAGW